MKTNINFTVEDIVFEEEQNPNSQFATARIQAFSSDKNRHDLFCTEETLINTAPSIYNKPILYSLDKTFDDFYTHTKPEKSLICGFVIPDSAEFNRLEDGRLALNVEAKIWKRYAPKVIQLFERDGGRKKVSVEMELYESRPIDDFLTRMVDFAYMGVTILGDFITEASPGANMQMVSFSEENEKFKQAYTQEFSSDPSVITFPYTSKEEVNPAIKGIEPTVSLQQANLIARWADEMSKSDNPPENPWAVAISKFKDTHEVKDGKWVRKKSNQSMAEEDYSGENNSEDTENMGLNEPEKEENSMKLKNKQENMADESQEEESQEEEAEETNMAESEEGDEEEKEKKDMMEPHKKEDSEKSEDEEDMAEEEDSEEDEDEEDSEEEDMASNLDMQVKEMALKIESLEKERDENLKTISELTSFKESIEKSQKEFAVNQTIKKLSEKVVLSDESKEKMVEMSEEYSLDNLEEWEIRCKAMSFEFPSKEKNEDGVDKIGLPHTTGFKKSDKDELWS